MLCPNSYREIKLEHGERVDQIKNFGQSDWIKACERLGLWVPEGSGKGSHQAVYKSNVCPPEISDCCVLTLPRNIYANFQRDLVKKLVFHGLKEKKYEEDDVWRALKIIK